MTCGELFAGIGGIGLGLKRAGVEVVWQVEKDDYCRRVLEKHWPDVTRYEDVKDVGAHNLEPVDLICGGFPCQSVSVAGKRQAQDDERWLWPEFARIIRELRPSYVLVENVPGLLVRGFGDVLGDLATLGYDAEWGCVSAASVGAPHLRERVFIVGHTNGEYEGALTRVRRGEDTKSGRGRDVSHAVGGELRDEPGRRDGQGGYGPSLARDDGEEGVVAHADSEWKPQSEGFIGQQRRRSVDCGKEVADTQSFGFEGAGTPAEEVWTTPGGDGQATWGDQWSVEPDVGRVAHGVPSRVDRLRALGNAVVPQVAEYVGRRIMTDVDAWEHI